MPVKLSYKVINFKSTHKKLKNYQLSKLYFLKNYVY